VRVSFDHAVIFVTDLRRAAEDFAALGFQVVPGGVHTGGVTHNALIPFSDGTYVELLAPTARWKLVALRLLGTTLSRIVFPQPFVRRAIRRARAGEGLVDFALACSPLSDIQDVAKAIGGVDGPARGGRIRPDGERISWTMAVPRSPALPFLIEDITPRHLRVPRNIVHPNGASGVQIAGVVTASFASTVARYQTLLGREPFETVAPIPRSRGAEFRLDNAAIRLVAPTGADHLLHKQLARGEGIYSLVLRSDRAANLDTVRAHGAQITLAKN
jgi:glyoxalase-like protein